MALALLYCRVSTEAQAEKYSLDDQLTECRRKARELGATETVEILDNGGGDHLERPMMQRALELCEAGGVGWFVCWDPDRFSRQLISQQLAADIIEAAGVELVFINHSYSKTPEGVLFFQMRGAIAQYEKAKILERTGRGKRSKARKGEVPGWVRPYGYRFNTETDRLEIVEAEARWVRQIYAWATDPDPGLRLTITQVASRLNATGVSAPRSNCWYRSTVGNILHNPLYTGVLWWGRFSHRGIFQARRAGARRRPRPLPVGEEDWHPIPVEPIITTEQWQAAARYLEQVRRRRSPRTIYMLTGMVRCGHCGGPVGRTGSGLYRCSRRYPHTQRSPAGRSRLVPCTLPHIQARRVEAFVWRTVRTWLEAPDVLARAGAMGLPPSISAGTMRELETIAAEIRENEAAQERLLTLVVRSGANTDAASRQMKQLSEQQESLRQRRALLSNHLAAFPHASEGAKVDPAALTAILDGLPESRRQETVRRLVSRVVLGGKGEDQWQVLPLE